MQSWINYRWDLTMDELLFLSLFVIDPRKLYSRRYPMVQAYSITKTQTDIRLKSVFVLFFSPSPSLSRTRKQPHTLTILFPSGPGCFVYYVLLGLESLYLWIDSGHAGRLVSVNRLHRWEITGPFINNMTSARA